MLRPGRLDRKIEIPLPNEQARLDILKIHSGGITKHGEIGACIGRSPARRVHAAPLLLTARAHKKSSSAAWRATDYEAVVKLSEGFNGADLRNICTEAGTSRGRVWRAAVPLAKPLGRCWDKGAGRAAHRHVCDSRRAGLLHP